MQITVRNWDGEPTQYEVEPECTIEELKIRIDVREGIIPDQQVISFNGRRLTEETYTLKDYEIDEGSILTLVRPRYQRQMEIVIQIITGIRFQLQVDAEDTVRDVKTKIQQHGACGRPSFEQRLLLRGRPIQDDATLREIGVKNNTVLHLVFRLRGGESTSYPWYIFQHIFTEEYNTECREWALRTNGFTQQSVPIYSLWDIFRGLFFPLPCNIRSATIAMFAFVFYMILFFLWFVIDQVSSAFQDKRKE